MANLYIPGVGTLPMKAIRVHNTVHEYDERLSFKLNDRTGQWCIMLAMPHGEEPRPLRGWDTIPEAYEALDFVRKSDTMTHASDLLKRIDDNNERIKNEYRAKAKDASWGAAEHTEFVLRKDGRTPYHKSFRLKPRG